MAAAGRPFVRVNPRQAREFARASGVLAKTDRVDARVLAEMAQRLDLPPSRPPEAARQRLQALILRRRQFVDVRKAEGQHLRTAADAMVAAGIRSLAGVLDAQIAALDHAIAGAITADAGLRATAQKLRAVPGVGPMTTAILLASLPELGQLDRRQIASLAGLAPLARDSGRSRGQRRIWGGRRRVREALYLAALSAARLVPTFARMRDRLRAAGKAPKTILIAIARRLLVVLNAMLRDGTDFRALA